MMEREGGADSYNALGESPSHGVGYRERLLPLNLLRVIGLVLRSVTAKLGLPTSASVEDLRQMISGHLTEQEREPRDILVTVTETKGF